MGFGMGRGLGRGIVDQFHAVRVTVVAVARSAAALEELASKHPGMRIEAADTTDQTVAGEVLHRWALTGLVVGTILVAINQGATWRP